MLRKTFLSALALLLVAGARPGLAQSAASDWVPLTDGVWERHLPEVDGERVERFALGVAGWRWVVDRLRQEEDRWDDLDDTRAALDLSNEVLRVQWALDALDRLALIYGDAELEDLLRQVRQDCAFSFDAGASASGGRPSSWVYPFGIRGLGSAAWSTGCGAEALVVSRVQAEARSPGLSSANGRASRTCLRRGTAVSCSARAQATGFAPCRLEALSAVAVPELAFYFEVEESSQGCTTTPSFPDPRAYLAR